MPGTTAGSRFRIGTGPWVPPTSSVSGRSGRWSGSARTGRERPWREPASTPASNHLLTSLWTTAGLWTTTGGAVR